MSAITTPQSANEALLADILGGAYETRVPQSRIEKIWAYALGATVALERPQSRIESLAILVAEQVRNGGGYTQEELDAAVAAALTDYQTNTEPQHIAAAEAAAVATYEGTVENGTY